MRSPQWSEGRTTLTKRNQGAGTRRWEIKWSIPTELFILSTSGDNFGKNYKRCSCPIVCVLMSHIKDHMIISRVCILGKSVGLQMSWYLSYRVTRTKERTVFLFSFRLLGSSELKVSVSGCYSSYPYLSLGLQVQFNPSLLDMTGIWGVLFLSCFNVSLVFLSFIKSIIRQKHLNCFSLLTKSQPFQNYMRSSCIITFSELWDWPGPLYSMASIVTPVFFLFWLFYATAELTLCSGNYFRWISDFKRC